MKRGYLVSFEGHDASGKTELLHRVNYDLRKRGYETSIVEEFSNSILGNYLRELLTKDKFLRLQNNIPTAFSGAMYVIADLYYQDEHEIKPRLNEGKLYLKNVISIHCLLARFQRSKMNTQILIQNYYIIG